MKYIIRRDVTFGWNHTIYDTDSMTRTESSGCGTYGNERTVVMTEEEMRQFINNRELAELKNFRYEMAKLQAKYDEKLKEIENFKKALDNKSA